MMGFQLTKDLVTRIRSKNIEVFKALADSKKWEVDIFIIEFNSLLVDELGFGFVLIISCTTWEQNTV